MEEDNTGRSQYMIGGSLQQVNREPPAPCDGPIMLRLVSVAESSSLVEDNAKPFLDIPLQDHMKSAFALSTSTTSLITAFHAMQGCIHAGPDVQLKLMLTTYYPRIYSCRTQSRHV